MSITRRAGLLDRLRIEGGVARSLLQRLRSRHGVWRDRLLARFVGPNDLVFDIGAHVGDCVASLRRLGARVVAVEPQPALVRSLRLLHGKDPAVVIEPVAVGACQAAGRLYQNRANPTVSTLSRDFVAAADGALGWRDQQWDAELEVDVTTLDALIERHGVPRFCKIDVEGHEAEVLRGLSDPLPSLSFEFTTIQSAVARHALAECERLGSYAYNAALGAESRLQHLEWLDSEAMALWIERLPAEANSGDVYAVRREP